VKAFSNRWSYASVVETLSFIPDVSPIRVIVAKQNDEFLIPVVHDPMFIPEEI
jgi:hypothetical protein